ncbi:filamin-B-like [Lycorma delicatula]|uniref:filamin-B-like n=1 Tax=Lycorma delicatula TaxID=130591 RepID=UPI003F515208
MSPSGNKVKAYVIPTNEGFLVDFTPTEPGEYLLSISFGGEPVSPTPYRLTCLHGSNTNRVRASGPGLERGVIGRPAEFMIDTRSAGQGGLGVTVEGPCEAAINCRDNGDGTCSVAYLPTEVGDYSINITFNDMHIPGSPFQAIIHPEANVKRIKASGNNTTSWCLVDSGAIGKVEDCKVTCTITNPSLSLTENHITSLADGTYRIGCYTPFEEGSTILSEFFNSYKN